MNERRGMSEGEVLVRGGSERGEIKERTEREAKERIE